MGLKCLCPCHAMPVKHWGSIPGWSKCLYGECDPPDDHAAWRSVRALYSMRFYNYGVWLFNCSSVLQPLYSCWNTMVDMSWWGMLYTHGFVYILLHLDIVHWIYIWGACILEQFHVHIQRMAARQKNISNFFPLQLPNLTVNQVNIAAYRPLGTIIALHPLNHQHQQSTQSPSQPQRSHKQNPAIKKNHKLPVQNKDQLF